MPLLARGVGDVAAARARGRRGGRPDDAGHRWPVHRPPRKCRARRLAAQRAEARARPRAARRRRVAPPLSAARSSTTTCRRCTSRSPASSSRRAASRLISAWPSATAPSCASSERVTGWTSDGEGLTVTTDKGSYSTAKLVVAAGAWLPKLAPELELPLTVERNAALLVRAGRVSPRSSPPIGCRSGSWSSTTSTPSTAFRHVPVTDDMPAQGAKVARHHGGRPVDPGIGRPRGDRRRRGAGARLHGAVTCRSPTGSGSTARVCMYTNTPDFNFVLDFHPRDDRVVIASPCSRPRLQVLEHHRPDRAPTWPSRAAPTSTSTSCQSDDSRTIETRHSDEL